MLKMKKITILNLKFEFNLSHLKSVYFIKLLHLLQVKKKYKL